MRLRLTHLPGLRIELERGCHVVPSHLSIAEVERLLDVLLSGIERVSHALIVEWSELDTVQITATSLVFVQLPAGVTLEHAEPRLQGLGARLVLAQQPAVPIWPEVAWDELEVKSALVAWWRKASADPRHPLAPLGLRELPIDALAAATAEPIEFLELVELTLDARGGGMPWPDCVEESLARRLAWRMRNLPEAARRSLLDASSDVRHLVEGADDALIRAGLAMPVGGSLVFSPLVRHGRRGEVRRLVEAAAPRMPAQAGMRVLVVLADPREHPSLDFNDQVHAIQVEVESAGGTVRIEFNAGIDRLLKICMSSQFDVVHFIGHGHDSKLVMHDGQEVALQTIVRIFMRAYPRAIVITACARLDTPAPVPVILPTTMVADSVVPHFARGFYAMLAAGRDIRESFDMGETFAHVHAAGDGSVFTLHMPATAPE